MKNQIKQKMMKVNNLVFIIILLSVQISCKSPKNENDNLTQNIESNISKMQVRINEKYAFLSSIKCDHFYLSDVKNLSNHIVNSLLDGRIENDSIIKFHELINIPKEYNKSDYLMNNDKLKINWLIYNIKIKEFIYLDTYLENILLTNFQTDLVGIKPININQKFDVIKGKKVKLQFEQFFMSNFIQNSKLVIDNDTIKSDDQGIFNVEYKYKKDKVDFMNAKIIIERWGKIETFEIGYEFK